jgi:hypothetical protein
LPGTHVHLLCRLPQQLDTLGGGDIHVGFGIVQLTQPGDQGQQFSIWLGQSFHTALKRLSALQLL